jgi:hypothetical protein
LTRSQSLEAALLASSAIVALIDTRSYPLVAVRPGSAIPAKTLIIYQWEVNFEYITLAGFGTANASLEMRHWAAAGYDEAHALADTVQSVLMPAGQPKGFNGFLGGASGIKVIQCRIRTETEHLAAIAPDQYVYEVISTYDLKYSL